MGKKIKDFSELPAWFRETDYLAAHGLSDIDWYFHLWSRFQVIEWDAEIEKLKIEQQSPEDLKLGDWIQETLDWYNQLRSEQLEIIRRQPASPIGSDVPLTELGPAFVEIGVEIRTRRIQPIVRMTLLDLYNTLRELPTNIQNDLLSHLKEDEPLMAHFEDSALYASYADLPITELLGRSHEVEAAYRTAYNMFRVDLSLPDDTLKKSFKEFLASARSDEQAYALYLDREIKVRYEKWVNYGVLPYIDLKIWAQENDRSITASFTVKVFEKYKSIQDPDHKYGAYTVDTTLKKYVDAALSIQTLRRLRGLASKEIERREKT